MTGSMYVFLNVLSMSDYKQIRDHVTDVRIRDAVYSSMGMDFRYECAVLLSDGTQATGKGRTKDLAASEAIKATYDYLNAKGQIKPEPVIEQLFSFDNALVLLKSGAKVARRGWNGQDQWIAINGYKPHVVPADQFWSKHNAEYAKDNGGTAEVLPCITLKNAQGQIVMGWIPSTGDLLAEDWCLV